VEEFGAGSRSEGGAAEILQRLAHTYLGRTSCSRTCPIPKPTP
jgi:hypothetical protein